MSISHQVKPWPWKHEIIFSFSCLYCSEITIYYLQFDPQYKRIDNIYWDWTVECYLFNMFTQKVEHFCVKCVIMVFYCRDVSRGREKNKEIKYYIFSQRTHFYCLVDNQIKRREGLIECKYKSDCIFAVANPAITDIKIIPNST